MALSYAFLPAWVLTLEPPLHVFSCDGELTNSNVPPALTVPSVKFHIKLVFRALNHNSWSRRNSSSSLDTSLISASLFSVPSTLLWRWNGSMQCTKEPPQLLQRSCKKSRGCLCIMSCAMKHLSGRRWSCASGSFIIMTTELWSCAREHQINGDSVITNTMHLIKFLYKHSFIFNFHSYNALLEVSKV